MRVKRVVEQFGISRSSFYYRPCRLEDLGLIQLVKKYALAKPSYGYRGVFEVSYSLKKPRAVFMALYNPLGQRVYRVFEAFQGRGVHRVRVEGRGLPSGLYFLRADIGGGKITRKALILR